MTSDDERRRQGLALQAELPEPSSRAMRRRPRSDGAEVAETTAALVLETGLWGLVIALPGAVIWLLSRRRRRQP
jgi:hypothetical protein